MRLGKTVKILAITAGVLAILIGGLVGYALATADGRLAYPETPLPALQASTDPAVIARGRYLVHGPAHCAQCHSTDNRNKPEEVYTTPLRGGLAFAMGPLGTRYGRNLTPDETGIKNITDAQLARVLQAGVLPDGELSFFMRFSASSLSDDDTVAVISYLRSLAPVRNEVPRGSWSAFGKVLMTYAFPLMAPRKPPAPTHVPPAEEPSVARGAYLSDHVALCSSCHTEFNMSTFESQGSKGAGSLPDPSHGDDSDMEFVAPNLTSHPTGVTGKLSEDAFLGLMRGGRKHASSIMPWETFRDMTDADLRSVYRYLKSLPPVDRDRGPSYRKAGWTPGG